MFSGWKLMSWNCALDSAQLSAHSPLAWFLSKHHHQVEWKLWMIALKARNAKMCFAKMTTIP